MACHLQPLTISDTQLSKTQRQHLQPAPICPLPRIHGRQTRLPLTLTSRHPATDQRRRHGGFIWQLEHGTDTRRWAVQTTRQHCGLLFAPTSTSWEKHILVPVWPSYNIFHKNFNPSTATAAISAAVARRLEVATSSPGVNIIVLGTKRWGTPMGVG